MTYAYSKIKESRVTQSGEILFEDVSKTFESEAVSAVDGVSLQVAAGDLVVFLGPSGSGKTTLLKMVNRLYEPTSGKIWIGDEDIQSLSINDLRRQIGYVIQQVGLFPHMTVKKNISVVPRLLDWEKDQIQSRVAMLLDLTGLPDTYLERYPNQLSGGEQQRVGLARALAADPDILLMDEPFAALDAINRERLQKELLRLHCKLDKIILFVTHDVEEALLLADKIAVLRDGKLIQYDTPIDLVTKPKNAFVEELVGTNNILRRLSLVSIESIIKAKGRLLDKPITMDQAMVEIPTIHSDADLRSALSLLLSSGSDYLRVEDSFGTDQGLISMEDLREMLSSNQLIEKKKCDEISD
ncbi:MAG TPA: ABC transporter ATP-binding protein [Anaerolineaceae bacterium]|nr:ABC transporter ATP-binding protein [Anaerolineaceae bacterium]